MANVEVQLDIKAEYRQALEAISNLNKALAAVQQRAKVALSVAGGAQGDADGAGKAEAEQKAAVEALSAAMKDAAAAAAMLTESVGKLTPALEAMGPQAEQVQQVLSLAEHYKQLADAMGVAAEAAAKYNASGAQQGETDARIQKLMEENQKLMELVSNIREEYAAIVRRNAELNRTRKEREENNKSVREEMEVTQDLTYQMQLAAMSKRELVAEIDRLIKARKEAARAGDESKYKELTEELKLARQAMTKLRQEQQLARIAWMQQAQTAQQMGQNIRTLAEGMTGFSESVENGTVNLTGMVSAVMSLSMAIKAGLGPLGWALLAVEALSMAWNSYAKSQKEAEEAEKKKQERIVNLTKAYHEAAAEVDKFKNAEARQAELNDLLSIYDDINARFRERNDLQEKSLRMIQAELAMQAKEEEQASVLARNDIMRAYWRGEIDEEERDSRLDRLKITQARNRKHQTSQLGQAKISAAKNKVSAAYSAREAAGIELGAILDDGQIYNLSPAELNKRVAAYNLALQTMQNRENKLAELQRNVAKAKHTPFSDDDIIAVSELREFQKNNNIDELRRDVEEKKRLLNGFSVEQIESGEYGERYEAYRKKYSEAQKRVQQAEKNISDAEEKLADAEEQYVLNLQQAEQSVRFAIQTAGQNVLYRKDKKDYDARKQAERARKEQERERLRIEKEEDKIMQQYADAIEAAEWSVAKGNKSRFKGKNASAINWLLNTALPAAKDGEMTSKQLETLIKAWEQAQKTKAKTDDEMVRVIANMLNDQKISDKKTRQKITAIRKNLR